MHAAAACSILLSLHLHTGSHLIEHSTYDDRVAWVLPPDRLAAFARAGVVINEEKKTRIVAVATVATTMRDMFTLNGTLDTTTVDEARHRAQHSLVTLASTVTPRNEPLPARVLDVEEAAMAELPTQRLCVGQSWLTRIPVVTTLGSGVASIQHKIVGFDGLLVEVDVKGSGIITGLEYNLPRLLPGSIGIAGRAWFDPAGGLITQESYVLHNRLIRTVHGKTIGFLETETVDVSTHAGAAKRVSRRQGKTRDR
jgi:hypothetical protein